MNKNTTKSCTAKSITAFFYYIHNLDANICTGRPRLPLHQVSSCTDRKRNCIFDVLFVNSTGTIHKDRGKPYLSYCAPISNYNRWDENTLVLQATYTSYGPYQCGWLSSIVN